LPVTTSVRASAEAFKASSLSIHLPSASAVADLDWPAKATVTVSPASAQPQTATGFSRWRTMWSEIGAARRKPAAKREVPPMKTASRRARKRGVRMLY